MEQESLNKLYRNIIIVFAGLLALILFIFLWLIPFIEYQNKPAYLDILVTPIDAEITINDQSYRNSTYELEPGTYTATIKKEGFKTKTFDLNLEKNKTTGLYLYLKPDKNDWSYYKTRKNLDSLNVLLRLYNLNNAGEEVRPTLSTIDQDKSADELIAENKIRQVTPIYYSICKKPATRMNCNAVSIEYDYDEKCNNQLCLILIGRSAKLDAEMLKEAKVKVKEQGYNFDRYKYTYIQNDDR